MINAEYDNTVKEIDINLMAIILRNMLVELHPKLPAYFCGNSRWIYPIPINEDINEFIKKHNVILLDAEGHVDIEVLGAIHKIIDREKEEMSVRIYNHGFLGVALRKEIRNPNSELSQALAKVYG